MTVRQSKGRRQSSRIAALLALAAAGAITQVAHAQADQFRFYFDSGISTAGSPIGGFEYLPDNSNPASSVFYTGSFGASGSLRKITGGGPWTGQTQVGFTPWVGNFLKSSSLTDNGGQGTILDNNYTSAFLFGDMQLNPTSLTVNSVTYAPNTLAVMIDAATVRTTVGSVLQPQYSKQVYAWDLRQVNSTLGSNTGRDRDGDTRVDWNDVFDTLVTIQDMQVVQGAVGSTANPNVGRRFAWSSSGQAMYFTDSQNTYGGIWKLNMAGGGNVLSKVVDNLSGTSIITEPAVVHTSVRDFGGGAGAGDQIFFRGSTATGNIGGLNYIVDTGSGFSPSKVALSPKQFAAFFDVDGATADITSITSDTDNGDLYFYTNGSQTGIYRYDDEGRIVKISSEAERRKFLRTIPLSYNSSVLDTKLKKVNVTLPNSSTVVLPQVLYSDVAAQGPIGVTAYLPGDFDRDNDLDAADIAAFKGKLGLRGQVMASIQTATPFNENNIGDLKYDLNGSTTVGGVAGVAIDWKDVKILQQFAGLSSGDVDMDFDVDYTDLGALNTNYNNGNNKLFTQGNLSSVRISAADKDTVNYADLVTIAANWTLAKPTAGDLSGYSPAFIADATRAFGVGGSGLPHRYVAKANGNWSNTANWTNGVPNGVDQQAHLLTDPLDDVNLNVDGNYTVGQLNFDHYFSYALTGSGTISIESSAGNAQINAFAASPTISAGVTIKSNTDINVAYAADTLTISGAFTNSNGGVGQAINKLGPGTLVISGPQTHAPGAVLNVVEGVANLATSSGPNLGAAVTSTLNFNITRELSSLTINNGGLAAIDAGATKVVKTASLVINGTGKLNVRNNKVVVTGGTLGSWNGSSYSGITGLIQSGLGTGTWNGNGIVTTETSATTGVLTTIAVATAEEVGYAGGTFSGVSVNTGDVLVMYTWGGDADMNGQLNGDDYFWLDSNILANQSSPSDPTYLGFHQGDFNYDGALNGDDYFILDSNILQAQGSSPWPTASGVAGLTAIPEPGVMGILGALAVAGSRRRRSTKLTAGKRGGLLKHSA